jgi:methylated-DNA-[protein]-cysteine S-methyltransferase
VSDVVTATLTHPFGTATVAATTLGVVRIAFDTEDPENVARELAGIGSVRHDPDRLAPECAWLEAALNGRPGGAPPAVDLRLARTEFSRDVLAAIAAIPAGSTLSYRDLATAAGHPTAVRAAAHACATNPVPLIIGCHRVIRSDGTPGNYRGGARLKELLLAREAPVAD